MRRRGRPTKLNEALATQLVALLAGGTTVTAAAEALGLDRRTLQLWRRRAYSTRAADQSYVALERRVQEALLAAVRRGPAGLEPWETIAARLERENPERWGAPDVGDVLDALDAPGPG